MRQKQKTVAIRAYSKLKSPRLITEIIKPLTERKTALNIAMQILDGQGHQKGTVNLVS